MVLSYIPVQYLVQFENSKLKKRENYNQDIDFHAVKIIARFSMYAEFALANSKPRHSTRFIQLC